MGSVFESNARLRDLPAAVARKFNFTRAEAQLCLGLLQGKTLSELADEQFDERSVVQQRYESLLAKTDTDTEAKLVTVVLSSTIPA